MDDVFKPVEILKMEDNWNVRLFFKINNMVGKNKWLDAFGRAGAEFVVLAMVGWYVASVFIARAPDKRAVLMPIIFLGASWLLGFAVDLLIGYFVREPRPQVTFPDRTKVLFNPLFDGWKSFPSDHTMLAFLIFFMALMFGLPGAEALLALALWVSWGRIYAGVHYPFDAVGGISVAGLMAVLSYYISVVFFI